MSATPLPWEIDCQSVSSLLQQNADFLLLDCREPDEFATANIPGAQLLPMSELQERVGELTPHRERHIVVHCHHGARSLRVARWLRSQGYDNVQSLAGGIDLWSQAIDPAVPRY